MNSNKNTGIGFIGVLQIVFIILKLCKVINWHWALVLLPAIISVGLWIIFLIIYLTFAIIENRRY